MGAAVAIGIIGTTPPDIVRTLAPRIERLGFSTLWINDVPGGDSLGGLRIAAEVTATLGLATGVIPLDRRPADSLDLGGLPVDRLTLGIGSGRADRPLGLVSDGIAFLRTKTDAPIVVGALGPRMRRLAAEQADGVLLNWLTPEAGDRAAAELRRDAGGRAVRTTLYVRTIVDESARPALDREVARYETVPSYVANFERIGMRATDATAADATAIAAYVDGGLDEVVLRAITPTASLSELEHFVEASAAWRAR